MTDISTNLKAFLCPFTTQDTCKTIPDVTYKTSWHAGGTGYIDGMKPSDDVFLTSPVVKFIDNASRSAISIKYTVICEHTTTNREYAITVFQRYSGSDYPWVGGGHHAERAVSGKLHGGISDSAMTWFESLLLNKQEKVGMYDYASDSEKECVVKLAGQNELPTDNLTSHADL